MIVFRVSGKRSLAQITTFDFVLLLVIGESTQQALVGNDFSITNAVLVTLTLLAVDIGLSILQQRFTFLGPLFDDVPVILVNEGEVLQQRMEKSRISRADILHAARANQGLERMERIKYAVLERTGEISIIPKSE